MICGLIHFAIRLFKVTSFVIYDDNGMANSIMAVLCRDYNCDSITIRLRYDYDPTTTYRARLLPILRKQKMNMSIFRRSRIVVESQL